MFRFNFVSEEDDDEEREQVEDHQEQQLQRPSHSLFPLHVVSMDVTNLKHQQHSLVKPDASRK